MQTGTGGVVDRIEFLYNRLSERIATRDQNGTVHAYEYGNVINQVKYEYGNNQKLARLYQAHSGAVNIFANEADVCTHDRNGNMTLMPGLKGKYDAWNRLVEVRDSANSLIARYDYNGINQRIQKVKDNVVTHSYFNEQWQELETIESPRSPNGTRSACVWGLRYIDDLIYRQRGTEKLYSLADPNWNVVAIADSTGAVQERLKYDAFGKVSGLTSDWNRTFTGQVLDSDTGLMLYRNRYYHTGLGRFVTRDPIGYGSEDNSIYRYVFNSPLNYADQEGKLGHVAGSCLAGGVVSGFIAWWNGGKPGCAAFGGCLTGTITAMFPSSIGGCIGGAVGGIASQLCSGGFCINSPCDVMQPLISAISGCFGGRAAALENDQIVFIAGLVGINTELYSGIVCG